jgi:hypothetical protein
LVNRESVVAFETPLQDARTAEEREMVPIFLDIVNIAVEIEANIVFPDYWCTTMG